MDRRGKVWNKENVAMIIRCEQCGTTYRLDETRIDRPVFKVRCSRCNHRFEARRPEEEVVVLREEQVEERCRVIAVSNQKGGVAKTSTTLNLGASLAIEGRRVLLVDFDVQANLTTALGFDGSRSFYDLLQDGGDLASCIRKTSYPNLALLPSNSRMALLTTRYLYRKRYEFLLHEHLRGLYANHDFILIDTPPVLGFLTFNALTAASEVIIPTPCEYLSMQGIRKMEQIITIISRKTGRAQDYRILLTMYDPSSTVARVVRSRLEADFSDRLFKTVIEHDPKMQESQIVHLPVYRYASEAPSARQYLELAREVMARA